MAAHLEDQLQEMRIRKNLEGTFLTKSTQLLVCQGQKLNSQMEKELEDEIEVCVSVFHITLYIIMSFLGNTADDGFFGPADAQEEAGGGGKGSQRAGGFF